MKKNLFIVLSAMLTCIMLTVGIILSVCGVFKADIDDTKNSIHTHEYSESWRTDAEFHWHECTAAGCGEKVKDKAGHTDRGFRAVRQVAQWLWHFGYQH